MIKTFFTADVHAGNHGKFGGEYKDGLNARARYVNDALATVVREVDECEGTLVIAGDLSDKHDPTAQVISALMVALSPKSSEAVARVEEGEVRVVVICGNHDRSSSGYHALEALEFVPGVVVVDNPTILELQHVDLACLPFQVGKGDEWLPRILSEMEWPKTRIGRPRVVVTHLGVRDDSTPWFLREASDSIDHGILADACAKAGVTHAFTGNWHSPCTWKKSGVVIRQCGALVPTGFDNPGHEYGVVAGLDHMTGDLEFLRCPGPRFLRAESTVAVNDLLDGRKEGDSLYLRLVVQGRELERATDAARLLKELGEIVDFEVVADRREAIAAADLAAQVVANAAAEGVSREDRISSLRRFVSGMSLPPSVDREWVISWVIKEMRL